MRETGKPADKKKQVSPAFLHHLKPLKMKNLQKILGLAVLLMLAFAACKEEDSTFCIKDILNTGTHDIGELIISVPGEQAYQGLGALPAPFKIGKYDGEISSVIIRQTPTETGMDVELRHYFDDGKGNKFWTHDHAVMTPLNAEQTRFNVYDEMSIWVGEGDFKCAEGLLVNDGVVDFATNKLEISVTGTICGGCD